MHWQYGTGSTDDERGIRWRIDEAMALLDEMATAADVGFAETHSGQKRKRDKSNPKHCGAALPCPDRCDAASYAEIATHRR